MMNNTHDDKDDTAYAETMNHSKSSQKKGGSTAGQKKILDVVGSRTFDFFNTREILYLSDIFDLFMTHTTKIPHATRVC